MFYNLDLRFVPSEMISTLITRNTFVCQLALETTKECIITQIPVPGKNSENLDFCLTTV